LPSIFFIQLWSTIVEHRPERRWTERESDPHDTDRLAQDCAIPPLLARLLVNRGICDPGSAARFLTPSLAEIHNPMLMLGMERATERLARAASRGERVCVYGDYDVDGVSSVALLISFFRGIGLDCFYHIPNRLEEGYGLSGEGIRSAADMKAAVIVTVDCGITAVTEAELCTSLGIDLIVTDHHTPGAVLPSAYAVLNPLQPGCPFPCKTLAGVGVAFNLLIALRGKLRAEGYFEKREEPNLREYLDLVALGTVADIVPLGDQNRIFVSYGLRELTNSVRIGMQALKRVAGVTGSVDCGMVGFRLAPRLNAAGRLEDAALGVELLLGNDPKKAAVIADELNASNAERQDIEQAILRDVLARIKEGSMLSTKKSIVLASEEWHPGVVGIVASRIVDLYHRPTILIALQDGNGRGSGRSIPSFHLHDALKACSEHLLKFGGHKYAAGLSIDETTLEAFVERFDAVADGLLAPEDMTPQLMIDAFLSPAEITLETTEMIASLEPFGMGNPAPVFAVRGARVAERRIVKERHLKLKLSLEGACFDAIGFNMADMPVVDGKVDAAFSLDVNSWNGKKSVQLKIRDIRPAAGGLDITSEGRSGG
jgi:single-stranded-DNA-specific exonuclease